MKYITKLLVILVSTLTIITVQAQESSNHDNLKDGLAIKGYDPVAYFHNKIAVKGNPQFSLTYQSAKYLFSSQKNLELFKSNPHYYKPQYGGWCAYAFAKGGGKIPINPKRFKILDNKLYLFYDNLLGPNTLKKWNEVDDAEQIKNANSQWSKISAQ